MISAYNDACNRFVSVALIFMLIMSFSMKYIVNMHDENIHIQSQLEEAAKKTEDYEEQLSEYHNLLDIEVNKNTKLSEENANLKERLEALEEEHEGCRKPIVYSSDNVLLPSNVTEADLESGLLYGLRDYAECFVEMEEKYGINAIFLASVAALESGWCRTDIAINNNNLFGYKNANGDGFRVFSSKKESIKVVSKCLKSSYLTEGAKYYNGLSVSDINIEYCEQSDWASKVDSIAKGIIERINNV